MTVSLAQVFESLALSATEREEAARTRLAACLTDLAKGVDTSLVRTAMETAAEALPYKQVLKDAETAGIHEALANMRKGLTRQLLTRALGSSTCQIRNEAARMDAEAAQRFLANTDGLLDHFPQEAVKEVAPEAEAAPESAETATPIETPKVTPAQKRTLEAIRDNGVKLQELKVGQALVQVERGEKPRRDMVEFVIERTWAEADTSRSLYAGQPVRLTAMGEAILSA
ncbi:hypothetical protein [Streptomyces sp. AGS-58]|uniref:hypothetical protein n=1 Tax=unclassified Streptomyces TaxID=2593676 RepID=UPI0035A30D3A